MENDKNLLSDQFSLFDQQELMAYLSEIARWGKFLSIVGFVMCGILVLTSFFFMFGLSSFSNLPGMGNMSFLGIFYLLFVVIYFFPIYYMYNFSVKLGTSIREQSFDLFLMGFQNLKSVFRFIGIFTLILLSFYAIALLIGLLAVIF
ncbi:MAG: hypothetical protein MUF42_07685 [Cytophagaceae bacterium]|jgi:hypothetical protein|nr:hypothetical protein [Cytophagaceae bacterium]